MIQEELTLPLLSEEANRLLSPKFHGMDINDNNSANTMDAKASQEQSKQIDFDSPSGGQEKQRRLKEMDRSFRTLMKQWNEFIPGIPQVDEVEAAVAIEDPDFFGYVPAVAYVSAVAGRPAQTVTMQIEGRDLVDVLETIHVLTANE